MSMEEIHMAKPVFEPRAGEETFAEKVSADCWKSPRQISGRQVSGKLYFTSQRVAFLASGLVGTASVSWEIELKEIAAVKTCTTPPFFPFGILITMKDGSQYKLAILKRAKYYNWLSEHIS